MKNSLGEKFNINFLVKPLYRKTKIHDRGNVEKGTIPFKFDRTIKLCGDDFNVRTVISKHGANVINVKRKVSEEYKVVLPGSCYGEKSGDSLNNYREIDLSKLICSQKNSHPPLEKVNTEMAESSIVNEGGTINNEEQNKKQTPDVVILHEVQNIDTPINNSIFRLSKVPDTWLRVYPAPKVNGESSHAVILRCCLCQLGLCTLLILWSIIAVFIIHSFEEPQEAKVSLDFEKEQNQLVIDLATELRQITPLSPKWRNAIEKRIEDERKLTMQAVSDGARLKPGQFWNLSGTFLFAVYVMTALGFGAPVPHTLWGRTSALVYAFLAIPTHIYLMVNASTCVVVHLEKKARHLREKFSGDADEAITSNYKNKRDNPNCSRNLNTSNTATVKKIHKYVVGLMDIIGIGRCIPLVTILYYTLGVVAFGVMRNKNPFETFMFPLEFTTTGGLDYVESYVRILYGFYVEGAMCLLACALATIRRHSSSAFTCLSQTHRLFETDVCEDCDKNMKK